MLAQWESGKLPQEIDMPTCAKHNIIITHQVEQVLKSEITYLAESLAL